MTIQQPTTPAGTHGAPARDAGPAAAVVPAAAGASAPQPAVRDAGAPAAHPAGTPAAHPAATDTPAPATNGGAARGANGSRGSAPAAAPVAPAAAPVPAAESTGAEGTEEPELTERTVPVEVDGKRFSVRLWLPDEELVAHELAHSPDEGRDGHRATLPGRPWG